MFPSQKAIRAGTQRGKRAGRPDDGPRLRIRSLSPVSIVLGLYVLVATGRVLDNFPAAGAFRPVLLLTAAAVALSALQPHSLRISNLFETRAAKLVLVLLGTATAASFAGLSVTASGAFLFSVWVPILVVIFLLMMSMRSDVEVRWISLCFVVSAGAVAYANVFVAERYHFSGYTRTGAVGMFDSNDIGVLYMCALPLALALIRSRDRILQMGGLASGIIIPASIAMTVSRGAFIGLVLGGASIIAFSPGWNWFKKGLFVAAAAGLFAVMTPPGYWVQMETILAIEEDYNYTEDTGRLAVWERGIGYVSEYPVLGVGPDNFIRAGWQLSPAGRSGLVGTGQRDQAPHNTFLQVWAELGTLGLAVWLCLLVGVPMRMWRVRRRLRALGGLEGIHTRFLFLLTSYLPASFVGFAVTTMFVSHAYTPIAYVLFAISVGVEVSTQRLWRTHRRSVGPAPGPSIAARLQRSEGPVAGAPTLR